MIYWLAVFTVLSMLLGAWAYFHRPGWLSVALYPVLCVALYLSGAEALSRAKPLWMEWRDLSDVEVIAYHFDEPHGIYLWLDIAGEPRAEVIPWNIEQAKQLQEASQKARDGDQKLKMNGNWERSLDGRERLFYAAPQPAPPPKG